MTILRYLGLGQESSFNTPVVATKHVDIASATLDVPPDKNIIFSGGLGRGARVFRPGFIAPTGNIVYPLDVNTLMDVLGWTLGGSATNFKYGSNDNILPSFTARLGKDLFEHVFGGCTMNNLEIAVEGELCNGTLDIIAASETSETIKTEDELLLVPEYPLAFHEVTLKQGATDISALVKKMSLKIGNNGSAEAGRGLGSSAPRRIVAGERTIAIDVDLYFDNVDQLTAYRNNTTSQYTITFEGGTGGSIDIILPKGLYTSVQQQASGRDELVQTATIKAFVGSYTDGIDTVTTDIVAKFTA